MPLIFSLRAFIGRRLDVPSRLNEVLFGLVMMLTVTLTAGLAVDDGPAGVRQLLLAAIGCNIAWGLIDALMYVMSEVTARARSGMPVDRILLRQASGRLAQDQVPGLSEAVTPCGLDKEAMDRPIRRSYSASGTPDLSPAASSSLSRSRMVMRPRVALIALTPTRICRRGDAGAARSPA